MSSISANSLFFYLKFSQPLIPNQYTIEITAKIIILSIYNVQKCDEQKY